MVSPFNKVCVFLNPCFDMVNGIWADFYHLMLDNVNDLDTRSGIRVANRDSRTENASKT